MFVTNFFKFRFDETSRARSNYRKSILFRAAAMTEENRKNLIERYAAGFAAIESALAGFPPDKLTARLVPEKWSAAEIVHHLADSEMTSALRLRKLLTEDFPVIFGYDQEAYAAKLRYNERPVAPALAALRAARETSLQLLEQMNEIDWRRAGWHTESGAYTIEKWLEIYAAHAHDHAAQIEKLRQSAAAGGSER